MEQAATLVAGELHDRDEMVRVQVRNGTRHSLYVRFEAPYTEAESARKDESRDFDDLLLRLNGRTVQLGRCRFLPLIANDHPEGRLILLDEKYELDDLLADGEPRIRESGAYFNIPLILSRKDRVGAAFKEFSANLHFEISVYKQFFDDLDREFEGEPATVRDQLQSIVMENEGRDFLEYFAERVEMLKDETRDFTKEDHDSHGFFFRRQMWDFILSSRLLRRTNLKPRGYPGDFEMLRMIYDNRDEGDTLFEKLMHRYPLNTNAAAAVRSRRQLMPSLVRRIRDARAGDRKVRLLSVACGQALELTEILESPDDARVLSISLLDQDEDALKAARGVAHGIARRLNSPLRVRFLAESVRTILRTRDPGREFGAYDFIYSMGLFDYLTPPTAKAVMGKLFRMLTPGGQLVVGNYHASNPDRIFMEYWADWSLIYRTEDELVDLTEGLSVADRNLFFEETGTQMFLQVTAP